jgi:hypothetical protein
MIRILTLLGPGLNPYMNMETGNIEEGAELLSLLRVRESSSG